MIKAFTQELSALRFEHVFNPYADHCDVYDLKHAADVRRKLLAQVLRKARDSQCCDLWIGRDLGYNGGRRTGLPFTDDVHLSEHGKRWGIVAKRSVKKSPVIAERSATVIWKALSGIEYPIFIWNVFPLHPHMSGEPFTNRAHNAAERKPGELLLQKLIGIIKPQRLMAIGDMAYASGQKMRFDGSLHKLRHPSYGGNRIFADQISDIYT